MEAELHKTIDSLHNIFYNVYYRNILLSDLKGVETLYIPPSGKEKDKNNEYTDHPDLQRSLITQVLQNVEPPPDVECDLNELTLSTLILGDGGSGKSTLALSLTHEFWKKYKESNTTCVRVLPIYIHLSVLQRHKKSLKRQSILELFFLLHSKFFENVVQQMDLFFKNLENSHVVLLLDGYDELRDKVNLWEDNHWADLKTMCIQSIAFTRAEAMDSYNFERKFRFNHRGQTLESKFFILQNFTFQQISTYLLRVVEFLRDIPESDIAINDPWMLTKECTAKHSIWESSSSEYRKWIDTILPELEELCQTPFVLTLLIQILPLIVEENRSHRLEPINLKTLISTEIGIYDQFTKKWFEYNARRIVAKYPTLDGIDLFEYLQTYAQNLAAKILQENKGWYKDGKISIKITEQWDLWMTRSDTEKISSIFPNSRDENVQDSQKLEHLLALRSGCPLRCYQFEPAGQNCFQFLHLSLLEYFVSRDVFKGLRAELNFQLRNRKLADDGSKFSLNREDIREPQYAALLGLLAKRVKDDSEFEQLLLTVVKSSRDSCFISTMSSNAFTILTTAKYVWNNEDFSFVDISSADMSHCIFSSCDFRGADMGNALLTGAWLYKCKLQIASCFGFNFTPGLRCDVESRGQLPICPQFSILGKGNSIVYINSEGELKQFSVIKKKVKLIFSNKSKKVIDFVQFSNSSKIVAILAEDGKAFGAQSAILLKVCDTEKKKNPMELQVRYPENFKIIYFGNIEDKKSELGHSFRIFTINAGKPDQNLVCYSSTPNSFKDVYGCPHTSPPFYFTGFFACSSKLTISTFPFNFEFLSQFPIPSHYFAISCSNKNSILLATSSFDCVTLFDVSSEEVLTKATMPGRSSDESNFVTTFMSFSPSGQYMTFDYEEYIYIWNRVKNSFTKIKFSNYKASNGAAPECLKFSESQNQIPIFAISFSHTSIQIIDLEGGHIMQNILDPDRRIGTFEFLDDRNITTLSPSGHLQSYEISPNLSPRSIQALKPSNDFQKYFDSAKDILDLIVVSNCGTRMLAKQFPKVQHGTVKIETVFVFEINNDTGKRKLVSQLLLSPKLRDISFVDQIFCILIYKSEIQFFNTETRNLEKCPEEFDSAWYDANNGHVVLLSNGKLKLCRVQVPLLQVLRKIIVPPEFKISKILFYSIGNKKFAFIVPKGKTECVYIWDLDQADFTPIVLSIEIEHVERIDIIAQEEGDNFSGGLFISCWPRDCYRAVVSSEGIAEMEKLSFSSIQFQHVGDGGIFVMRVSRETMVFGVVIGLKIDFKFEFKPFIDIDGFQCVISSDKVLIWDKDNNGLLCISVDSTKLVAWNGEMEDFNDFEIVWADRMSPRLSLSRSNCTNTVLNPLQDWSHLAKRFGVVGEVKSYKNSFIQYSSIFDEISPVHESIFSNDAVKLSEENWLLFIIVRKNKIAGSVVMHNHTGLILEGIKNGKHFAFRADLARNQGSQIEVTVKPLKLNLKKYLRLRKTYLAKEYPVKSLQGMALVETILKEKQIEIDYNVEIKNCNTWLRRVIEEACQIDIHQNESTSRILGRKVDLPTNFFKKKDLPRGVITSPYLIASGTSS